MLRRSLVLTGAILGALIAVVLAGEAATEIKVKEGHPKIMLTPERIDALRKKLATEPMPGSDIGARALSYILKGDESGAKDAIKAMTDFDLSEEVLTKKVASDEYRWQAYVPVIYDWCHDKMTAEERDKFLARYGRIVEAMNAKKWGGPDMPGSNYFAGYMRNSGVFGLAASGESPMAQGALDNAFVTRWRNSSLPFYASGARGGIVGEGSQYDRYNTSYILWLAEAAKTASNIDMYKDTNFFREYAYYTIYSTTPVDARAKGEVDAYRQRFPFGDCEFWGGYPAVDELTGDSMRAISLAYAGEKVGQHAAWYVQDVESDKGLFGWMVEDGRKVDPVEFKDLPLDYYAPGAEYAFARSGWEDAATVVMLQLGAAKGGSHHHQDAGTFQIVRGGSWITKESTGYDMKLKGTTSDQPLAHNSVVFDGRGQAPAYPDGAPEVLAVESKPFFFHAAVDLSKAYRASASPYKDRDDTPGAVRCIREFIYIRPDLLIIFDRMESATPEVKKTFALHFAEKPEDKTEERPPVISSTDPAHEAMKKIRYFLLETGGSQTTFQTVYPKDVQYELVDEGDVPAGDKKDTPEFYQWRLEGSQSGSKDAYFLTIVAAQEKFEGPPSFDLVEKEDSIGAIISQPGRKSQVYFNKKAGDSFGKLIIDAAGAYGHAESNLPLGMETITVSADGVRWSKPIE